MYEKRRDWEKLLGLQRREAENIPAGPERAQKFLEMAKLATERVKKPDVCIELWNEVIASDDSNPEALAALSVLYERSKEFDKLASVLEKQAEITYDTAQKIQVLNKLGTIYGDRLNNDEGAVTAWRTLLTLDPNDRKAQEALKKKYLALGRWDDLEVFYAETGKWDEFIRVLEQQEAKEANAQAKIGMLFKIAELWADKKQKADRAAKSYEKVLELEPNNLRAAESLIPIYTAAGNAKLLANAIEVKLSHQENADDKLAAPARGRRSLRRTREGAGEGVRPLFVRVRDRTARRAVVHRRRARREGDARLGSSDRGVPRGDRERKARRDLAIQLRLKLGRVLVGEVQRIDEALAAYRAVYEADGENADAIQALEALYRQTQAWQRAPRHLREEARPRDRLAREEDDQLRDREALRDRGQRRRQGDRDVRRRPRRRADRRRRRSPRSTYSTAASNAGSPTSTFFVGASSSTTTKSRSSTSSTASARRSRST